MTDRELLEAAAKAYWGDEIDDVVSVEWGEQDESILYTHGENQDHNGQDRTFRWNPLEEDADAFGLQVRLGILVKFDREDEVYAAAGDGWEYPETYDEHGGDPLAATRRAITRAAAEIGRALDGGET